MQIRDFSTSELIIIHPLVIDEDNFFYSMQMEKINKNESIENYKTFNDKFLLFDQYFNENLKHNNFNVFLFEIVKKSQILNLSDYYIFNENYLSKNYSSDINEKQKKFKKNHKMFLSFNLNSENLINNNFEFFLLENDDFYINFNFSSNSFYFEIFSDCIYKNLLKSKLNSNIEILKSFHYYYLDNKIDSKKNYDNLPLKL